MPVNLSQNTGFLVTPGIKTIEAGSLWAWGVNGNYQLGNHSASNYSSPIQVGLFTDWAQVASGVNHTMGVKTDGTLWGWGLGQYGVLGNNSTGTYVSPIQIGSLTNWKQVACGYYNTLAVKTDGTLWGCGYGAYSILPSTYISLIQIGTLTNWKQVSVYYNAAAVKTDGTLWAWGYGPYGALGDGTTVTYVSPIQIGSLTNWSQVSVGLYSTAAVKTDGTLWGWGANFYGALGNGTTISYSSPVQMGSLTNWSQVSVGQYNIAAIKTDGTLWACGYGTYGRLGNGTTISYSSPVQIGSLTNWKQVATGQGFTAAVKTDGTLWNWGYNANWRLGNGTTIDYSSPIQVGSLNIWGQVSVGSSQTFAIPSAPYYNRLGSQTIYGNSLWMWGYGGYGNLGNGTTVNYSSPIQIGLLTNWKQASSGLYNKNNAAVKTDGTLWISGRNNNGQLGNGTTINYSSPIQIGNLTNWSQVSCGYSDNFMIKTDGTLWSCGKNEYGRLGNGTTIDYSSPIQVGALTNWKQVSAGYYYQVLAIKTDGTLWSWGSNDYGGMGNGTYNNRYSSPVQVGSLTNWSQVSCGELHAAAIKTDGTLWAWGRDGYGQLGNGTTINYSSPIQVGLLTYWSQVSCGEKHTAAIKTDGTLWAWGLNNLGQLGNGTTIVSFSSPIQVGSLTNWKQVAGGHQHTAAIKTDGTLWTWGWNNVGQLGDGTTNNSSSPIQIGSLTNWGSIEAGGSCTIAIPSFTLSYYPSQDLGKRYVSKDYLLDVYPNIASATGARTAPGLWSWGRNYGGNLANGTTSSYSSPIQVGSLTNWKSVGAGYFAFFATKTDGTLWVCGYNNMGTLGNGTTSSYSSPIQIGALTNWAKVFPNDRAFFAIKTDGTLWACGYNNSDGALGNGTTVKYSSPIQIGALTNWKQISTKTMTFTLAVKTDGTLWSWGSSTGYGALGNGTASEKYSSPIQIGSLTNWKQVESGSNAGYGIKTDGTLWTWGWGAKGQLGLNYTLNYVSVPNWGTNISYSSPVQIGSLTNWKQVTGSVPGSYFAAAIKTDGTLWTWGENSYGQLGNGTTIDYASPIQVGSLTNWKYVVTGQSGRLFALKNDGTVWACGYNSHGTTGNGTTIDYSSPIQIGSLSNWKQISSRDANYVIADGYY